MIEVHKVQKRGRKKKVIEEEDINKEENHIKEDGVQDVVEDNVKDVVEDVIVQEDIVQEDIVQEDIVNKEKETIIIKKKRGRKPKNEISKDEEQENEEKEDEEKEKEDDENSENIVYKKRGRKPRPKEKVYNIKELSYENYDEDKNETLILHLPIKSSDIFSNNIPKGISGQKTPIATYNLDGTYEQTPIQQLPINESTKYEEILKNTQIKKKDYTVVFEENNEDTKVNVIEEYDKKVKEFKDFKEFNLMNYVKIISKNNDNNSNNSSDLNEMEDNIHGGNGTLLKDIENDQVNVTNFKANPFMESTHIENEIIQEHSNKMNKKNLKNIMVEFINANMYQEWPDQTNIHCWWCCHQFDGPPCTLPEYIRRDKFYVSGCFCSFNCAASYNFNKNDNTVWERYTLLNLMYKKLHNLTFVKIEMAPPREVLKMFGGYMDIEEFRNYCIKQDRRFQVIKPPLISIIPKIEEHIYPKNKAVNENIVNNTQTKLKLTRSKPLIAEKSTIQTFMNITTKKDDDE
jgi:hypothetical protein